MAIPCYLAHNTVFQLLCYLLHTFYRRVTGFLVYAFQFYAFHTIVLTYFFCRRCYVITKSVVQYEEQFRRLIVLFHPWKHLCHCRPEWPQVFFAYVVVFKFAYRWLRPAVVGCSEDEDNIWIAKIIHSCGERAVAVVFLPVSSVADSRSAVRVVLLQLPSFLFNKQRPPRLFHTIDISLFRVVLLEIPYCVSFGYRTFESGIRVAQYGNALLLRHCHKAKQKH